MTVRGMRLLEVESRRKGGANREIDINFGKGESWEKKQAATFDFIPLMEKGKGRAHLSEM